MHEGGAESFKSDEIEFPELDADMDQMPHSEFVVEMASSVRGTL